MSRLILILVVLAVGYWLYRRLRLPAPHAHSAERPVEDMVRCADCGVFLPASAARWRDGRHFCEKHR